MPKLEYFIVAESVAVDSLSGRASAFHILEECFPQSLPALLPKCVAVAAWRFEDVELQTDFQARLRAKAPGGLQDLEIKANFSPKSRIHRIINKIVGVPLLEAGTIEFELELDGQHCATHSLTVHEPDASRSTDGTLIYGDFQIRQPPDTPKPQTNNQSEAAGKTGASHSAPRAD